jgi:hypothetical protein
VRVLDAFQERYDKLPASLQQMEQVIGLNQRNGLGLDTDALVMGSSRDPLKLLRIGDFERDVGARAPILKIVEFNGKLMRDEDPLDVLGAPGIDGFTRLNPVEFDEGLVVVDPARGFFNGRSLRRPLRGTRVVWWSFHECRNIT